MKTPRLLLVSLALVAPTLTAIPAGAISQSISGTVLDGATGSPFDATTTVSVDAFEVTSHLRYVTFDYDHSTGAYLLQDAGNVLPGTYRVRVRAWDTGSPSNFIRYQWYGGGTTFETGTDVVIGIGSNPTIDLSPLAITGDQFTGNVTPTPKFDGIPPDCMAIQPYEATSGIGLGWIMGADTVGAITFSGIIPDGDYRALTIWNTQMAGCETAEYLGGWYGGGSVGMNAFTSDNVGTPDGFGLGATFTIAAGSPLTDIDFALVPMPRCFGLWPTMVGTDLGETITGTTGPDVILGLGGNDTIYGLDGADRICSGNGPDVVSAGIGNDRVSGGSGPDRLLGESGNDLLLGGPGNDTVIGGLNDDNLLGGTGNDRLLAGPGNDKLWGQAGDDRLFGGGGNDRLYGGAGVGDTDDGGAGVADLCRTAAVLIRCEI